MLPIVRRELQVAARQRGLYWQRPIIGGLAAVVGVAYMLFSSVAQADIGSAMFGILSWGVFIITMLDGIRCAGDAISWERREGTLGLLFLTDLRAYDVVFGKLTTGAIRALTPLLATFPILALPLLLGGVTPGEWSRTMLTLVTSAVFSLAAALSFSAANRSALASMGGAAAFLIAWIGLNTILRTVDATEWLWACGPLSMLLSADAISFSAESRIFWNALWFSLGTSGLMLLAACHLVARRGSFDSKPRKETWWKRIIEPRPSLKRACDDAGLDASPALWLARRTLPGQRVLWILTAIGALSACFAMISGTTSSMIATGIAVQLGFCFLIKLWLGVVAPQSIHAAQSCGAIELLLCTPVRANNLVEGQMRALRNYILPPAAVVCFAFPIVSLFAGMLFGTEFREMKTAFIVLLIAGTASFIIFLIDFFALAYTGLWFGLTSRRIEQAVGRTVGFVLLLPWLAVIIPFVGFMVLPVWPIYWICWSKFKIDFFFRKQAEQGYV